MGEIMILMQKYHTYDMSHMRIIMANILIWAHNNCITNSQSLNMQIMLASYLRYRNHSIYICLTIPWATLHQSMYIAIHTIRYIARLFYYYCIAVSVLWILEI